MSILATCPSCSRQLRVPEAAAGKKLRCPQCTSVFVLAGQTPEVLQPAGPAPAPARPTRRDDIQKAPPPRGGAGEEPELLTEDAGEPRPRRKGLRGKKKFKKKLRKIARKEQPLPAWLWPVLGGVLGLVLAVAGALAYFGEPGGNVRFGAMWVLVAVPVLSLISVAARVLRVGGSDDDEPLVWPWWVFGGGFVALLVVGFVCMAAFSSSFLMKIAAVVFLVSLPFSIVIFFIAMYISSVMLGAMEIGDLRVSIPKAILLIALINMVSLVPIMGGYLALPVWVVGLMVLFRLDLWECRMLLFINWILNFALRYGLVMLVTAMVMGRMERGEGLGQPPGLWPGAQEQPGEVNPLQPPPPEGWDEQDVKQHGGTVQNDPAGGDEGDVVAISFKGAKITDADLAHMKDFPSLVRLDLTDCVITDDGLAKLKACQGLRHLTVRGTRVTDDGVKDLLAALPQLKVIH
jgi:hypothetical protein